MDQSLDFFFIVYVILAKNHVPEKTDKYYMNITFKLLETIKYHQPFKGLYGALCLAIVTKIYGFCPNRLFCLQNFRSSFQFCPEKFLFRFICLTNFHILSSFHTIIKTDIKQQTLENVLKL